MKILIERIKLRNFKRFSSCDIKFNQDINIFVGNNDAGKSTFLQAIDICLSGSRSKIEALGLESLINAQSVDSFMQGEQSQKIFNNLPKCSIEIFFDSTEEVDLYGEYNPSSEAGYGIVFLIEPNPEFKQEIEEFLVQGSSAFPFDYYSINFRTFSGKAYSGYKKYSKHLLIDSSLVSNEYATRSYIRTVYESLAIDTDKRNHMAEYRKTKKDFEQAALSNLNDRLDAETNFSIRSDTKSNFFTDLSISENGIDIGNLGKGKQSFIRTEFALKKDTSESGLDFVLLEEPENHLSSVNMNALVDKISSTNHAQLFIATHSSLVTARLGLVNCVLLGANNESYCQLNSLDPETSNFFSKTPNHNVLELACSSKVILVEGAAEYILIAQMFFQTTGSTIEEAGVHVISVNGLSFERYLQVTVHNGVKVAVLTDNDSNPESVKSKYSEYEQNENIGVFFEENAEIYTFEKAIFQCNENLCNDVFARSKSPLDFMLNNKSEAAFRLLSRAEELETPDYIKRLLLWIND